MEQRWPQSQLTEGKYLSNKPRLRNACEMCSTGGREQPISCRMATTETAFLSGRFNRCEGQQQLSSANPIPSRRWQCPVNMRSSRSVRPKTATVVTQGDYGQGMMEAFEHTVPRPKVYTFSKAPRCLLALPTPATPEPSEARPAHEGTPTGIASREAGISFGKELGRESPVYFQAQPAASPSPPRGRSATPTLPEKVSNSTAERRQSTVAMNQDYREALKAMKTVQEFYEAVKMKEVEEARQKQREEEAARRAILRKNSHDSPTSQASHQAKGSPTAKPPTEMELKQAAFAKL
eukprot:Sspe_Gene.57230::Locus_31416_Transcript_1_1_Confidence_1.000_Length_927::g.57230::m.57230